MNDVIALGELLIDFTPNGVSEQGNPTLEVNPGGAPCNVLAILNKLGCKTEFIGKVGNDGFGKLLKQTLIEEGIGSKGLILSEEYNTTAAFVHLDENGERSFSFYRNIGADIMLNEDEIDEKLIKNSKVFHFGTLSLTHNPAHNATKRAIQIAKDNNLLISFDPNYRPALWSNEQDAKDAIIYGLKNCDIVKIADNELEFITGTADIKEGIIKLREDYKIKLILVTLGGNGSVYCYEDNIGHRHGFKSKVVDTTGAGDSFCGAMLYKILDKGIENITTDYLNESLDFANAAASIVITKRGALKSMPTIDDIIKQMNLLNNEDIE